MVAATTPKTTTHKSRTVNPTDVYTLNSATDLLGVRVNTLPREIRLRRLRASKRGGRYFILGEWLLEWIKRGEIRRPVADTSDANADQSQAEAG